MKQITVLFVAGVLAIGAMPAMADDMSRAELETLVQTQAQQIQQLQLQMNEIMGMVQGVQAQQVELSADLERTASYQMADWLDRTSVSGDLRVRYKYIDFDLADALDDIDFDELGFDEGDFYDLLDMYGFDFGDIGDVDLEDLLDDSGDLFQGRARVKVTSQIAEDMVIGIRFVTGSDFGGMFDDESDFGDAFAKDSAWFDLYYATWTPTEWFSLTAGKFENPFTSTSMLFDRDDPVSMNSDPDIQPEGLAQEFSWANDTIDLRLRLLEALFSEIGHSEFGDDTWLLGIQGGGYFMIADEMQLDAFIGYYDFTEGVNEFVDAIEDDDGDAGLLQGFLAFHYLGIENLPLCLYGEWVHNTDADDYENAWRVGFQAGEAAMANTWEAGVFYQKAEAYALNPFMTDTDFFFAHIPFTGLVGSEGFGVQAAYAVRDNIVARATALLADEEVGPSMDINTYMVDVTWKF